MARGQETASTIGSLKQMSIDELMSVEVTSVSRHPEKLFDAASAIQVITGDDIRRSGSLTIAEALRLADNLDVAQKNSHDWGITARGFNTDLANKLLVMIDGRTVYTPLFSGVYWDQQDYILADLDRIEVVSGPGGSLWGANAVNGVINIATKSAKATQGWYAETATGSELSGLFGARYGGELAPGVFFRVYAKEANYGNSVLPTGVAGEDDWRRAQGGFRIDAEGADGNAFTIQGDAYRGTVHDPVGSTSQDSGGNVLGRWTRKTGPDSETSLQVYFDRSNLKQPVPALLLGTLPLAPAGTFEDGLSTFDVDFQQQFALGAKQSVTWGLGYRRIEDRAKNAPSLGFVPADLDQDIFSGFLQDEIRLNSAVTLTLGTKVEHNDYTGREVEPSGRLQWNASATQLVWAAFSRAVRTPSRVDRDISEGVPPTFVLLRGDSQFTSESVIAHELGYRAQIDRRTALSLATFYNDYSDVRSTSITATTIVPFYFANNLEGETHGAELTLDFNPTETWRLHAGYRLIREDLHVKPGAFDLNNALNETSDPEQQVTLRSSLDLSHQVELDVALRWVDERPTHDGATLGFVPSYAEADARIAWRPTTQLELSLSGRNLLHAHHPEYGYPGPSREEIPRTVYGKVAWRY